MGHVFSDALEDLAQNAVLTRYTTNNVISQQGDRGHRYELLTEPHYKFMLVTLSLYFILRGKVTIYIDPCFVDKGSCRDLLGQSSSQYFSHTKPKSSSQKNKNSFGTDVRCLVTGNCFNESAVITKEGILIYTAITDEPTDCILISKKLFNRTLSEKFKLDILNKLEFVGTLAHNCNWAPNAVMNLALSVWEETYPFGSFIATEGKAINSLYAIKSGVVKLSVDPSKDVPSEVLNLISPPQNHLVDILSQSKQLSSEESERKRKAHTQYHLSSLQYSVARIKRNYTSTLKNKANICMLGPGDFVGSVEGLFNIKFSNFTAVCDSPVTVYCLDHVNLQLWITKRYPFSARHMHLVNQTILIEWTNRLRGAAILSCLLAMTNQELTRLQHTLVKKRFDKISGGMKEGYSPKQLALRIARSVATFSWNQEEISKLTKDAEMTDSAFFSQPFTSSCLQAASSDTLGRWKDNATARPFTAPSKLALESGIIISTLSLASVDKNKKHFQPCFDHPLSKPHKRVSLQEAFTIPMPSSYLSSPDQEQGVILEENCKLDDSVCTELSLSLEGIHDNSTSLTTVSSLPDNCDISKVDLQDKNRTQQVSTNASQQGNIANEVSSVFTPPEDPVKGGNVSSCPHCKTHCDPPQWTTGYPATPANSPIKRSVRSPGNRYRVSSAMHTKLHDSPITPVMEESLSSSSSSETLLEEIEEPKHQSEPCSGMNQATSHLSMQQFTFPHAGRPASNKLHRYAKLLCCIW